MKIVVVVLSALAAFVEAKPSGILAPHLVYSSPTIIAPGYVSGIQSALVAQPIFAGPISSQYHAQDTLGQYTYGYASPLSSKTETKTVDGITRGGYSYLDAEGKVQLASYVADPINGFRVAATNIPVGPTANLAPIQLAPQQVGDTVEVAAAKVAHFAAQEEAKARVAAANAIEAASAKIAAIPTVAVAPASVSAVPLPIGAVATAPITAAFAPVSQVEVRFNTSPLVETKTAENVAETQTTENADREKEEVSDDAVTITKAAEAVPAVPAIPAATVGVAEIPTTGIIAPTSYSYTSVIGASPQFVSIPSGYTYNTFATPGLNIVQQVPSGAVVAAAPAPAADSVEVTAAKSAELKAAQVGAEVKAAQPATINLAQPAAISALPIPVPINYIPNWAFTTQK